MSKKNVNRYRALLETKRAELEQEIAETLRDRERLAAVRVSEEMDGAALTAEREFAATNLDRLTKLLRKVKFAVQRMEDGSYGVCQRCEEPISAARLKAVPWAEHCVPCQEIVEHEQREVAAER